MSMPELSQEQLAQEIEAQKAEFEFCVNSGMWKNISKDKFSLLSLSDEQIIYYIQVAQDQREKILAQELDSLPGKFQRASSETAKKILAGRLKEVQKEYDELIIIRYQDTIPENVDDFKEKATLLSLDRDVATGIRVLQEAGDYDGLTVANIPELALVSPLALIRIRLDAARTAYNAAVAQETVDIGANKPFGLVQGEGGTTNPIEEFAKRSKFHIAIRMTEIAAEGLQYLPEIPKETKLGE